MDIPDIDKIEELVLQDIVHKLPEEERERIFYQTVEHTHVWIQVLKSLIKRTESAIRKEKETLSYIQRLRESLEGRNVDTRKQNIIEEGRVNTKVNQLRDKLEQLERRYTEAARQAVKLSGDRYEGRLEKRTTRKNRYTATEQYANGYIAGWRKGIGAMYSLIGCRSHDIGIAPEKAYEKCYDFLKGPLQEWAQNPEEKRPLFNREEEY